MQMPLTEPTSAPGARYVYINPKTNQVHLLMPVVGGVGIGVDNTCASVRGMQAFLGLSRDAHQIAVLDNLKQYKEALLFDLSLLNEGSELHQKKSDRLLQIERYIKILEAIKGNRILGGLTKEFPEYPEPIQDLMQHKDSNLHSVVLRPRHKDEYLRFVNPVFTVKRDGADEGQVLYQTLTQAYQGVKPLDAKAMLIADIAHNEVSQSLSFEDLQQTLQKEVQYRFKKRVDFTKDAKGKARARSPKCFKKH